MAEVNTGRVGNNLPRLSTTEGISRECLEAKAWWAGAERKA